MIDEAAIRLRWDTVGSGLDERGRRLFAAAEVRSAGRGGLAAVAKITGLARSTINRGEKDLDGRPLPKGGFVVAVAGVVRFARTTRGSFPRSRPAEGPANDYDHAWRVYLSASVTHQSEPDHAHFEAHSDHRIRRNPQPSRLLLPSPCRRLARRRRTRPIWMSCAAWRLSPSRPNERWPGSAGGKLLQHRRDPAWRRRPADPPAVCHAAATGAARCLH
jgi:hypothetical protein